MKNILFSTALLICFYASGLMAQNSPTIEAATFDIDEVGINGTSGDGIVGTVTAEDIDLDILSFEIVSGNIDDAFFIDANGEISIDNEAPVDFETNPVFTLEVQVSDDEAPAQTAVATIIININNISPNDYCTNAITVQVGDNFSGSTFDATNDGAIAPNCGGNSTDVDDGSLGVWYHIVGNGETITISSCSGLKYDFDDTSLSVYSGSCNLGLSCLAGNEDANLTTTCGADGYQAILKFPSELGVDYYFIVDGYEDSSGDFDIAISSAPTPPPPANDNCSGAQPLTIFTEGNGTPTNGDNTTAQAFSSVVYCDEFSNVNDVWYSFNSGNNTQVNIIVTSVDTDDTGPLEAMEGAYFELYETCGGEALEICGGEDGELIDLTPDTDYLVQLWDAEAFQPGTFTILLNDGPNTAATVSSSTVSISRYASNGDLVESILVADDENHEQVLTITAGNEEGIFSIDSETQEVSIVDEAALLASATTQFTLTIQAADAGPGSLTSTGTLTVDIIDNQAPVASDETISINENTLNSTVVTTVSATDADLDEIAFSIIGGNDNNAFAISSIGEITVNNETALNFEVTPVFVLKIQVTDDGLLNLKDTAEITINLLDVNEAPIVSTGNINISTSTPQQTVIGTASFLDEDAGQTYSYDITAGNTNAIFAIEASTGAITISDAAELTAGGAATYVLTIEVTDDGTPVETGTNSFTINTFVNTAPIITEEGFDIAENAANTTVVGQVTAVDNEVDDVTFYIMGGNELGVFFLTSLGELQVANNSALNFEVNPEFELEILAQDNGPGNLTSTGTVTISLTDVNEAPTLIALELYISSLASQGFSLGTLTVEDPEEDALFYSILSGNNEGTFEINTNTGEVLLLNPANLNPAEKPLYELEIAASDGELEGSAFLDVYVVANTYPELVNNTFDIAEDISTGSVVGQLSSNDPDGIIEFSIISGNEDNQFALDSETGELTINDNSMIDAETNNQYQLSVQLTDGGIGNLSIERQITINVTDINEFTPVLAAIGDKTVNELEALTFNASASDEDLTSSLTYSLDATALSSGMSIDASSGAFSWTPTEAQNGSYSVTVSVSDGTLIASEEISIDVNEVNTAPVLAAIGEQSITVGEILSFTASATDTDLPANTLSYSLDATSLAAGMSINASTGIFNWTPTVAQSGNFTVTILVSDGSLTASEVINILVTTVNEAPVLAATGNQTVAENTLLTFTASATDADFPINTLTYSLDAASISNGMSIDASSGVFSWTPTEAQDGSYSVTISVNDGSLTASEEINITVTETNEAPVLAAIGDQTVVENTALTFTATATDADLPANTLTYSLDATSVSEEMSIDASSGVFSWTPTEAQNGSYAVTISVSDGSLTASETINITVTETNEVPVLAAIGDQTIAENMALTFTAAATDADLPVNTLRYALDAASISNGMSIDANSGVFSWTPTEAQDGSYSVTISVNDGSLTASEEINITVTETNEAPVLAAIGDQTVVEHTALTFTASATDVDLPANTLAYSLDATSISNGMSIEASSGIYSWTPTEAQNGSYTVTISVSDGSLLASETIDITVTETNEAPVLAAIGDQSIAENTLLTFTAMATDADLPANTLTYNLDASSISNGMAIDANSGVYSWTPSESQDGNYQVIITVSDGSLTASEEILISVNEVNTAPVLAAMEEQIVTVGELLSFTVTATDIDLPANTLTYSLDASSLSNGMSINETSGVFNWTPAEEQAGNYVVMVTVSDGILTNTAAVNITVEQVLGIRSQHTLSIKVYPNPTSQYLRIEGKAIQAIELLDVSGKWIRSYPITDQIDVSALSAGIYLLQVKGKNEEVGTVRFVKHN